MDNIYSVGGRALQAAKKAVKESRETKYLEDCKKRLKTIISKKIRTSFIGALAQFEENFGFLWGYNSKEPLTQEQQDFKELWERVRTAILNGGNHQIRAAQNEIDNQTISWNRYHMDLPVRERKNEG